MTKTQGIEFLRLLALLEADLGVVVQGLYYRRESSQKTGHGRPEAMVKLARDNPREPELAFELPAARS